MLQSVEVTSFTPTDSCFAVFARITVTYLPKVSTSKDSKKPKDTQNNVTS